MKNYGQGDEVKNQFGQPVGGASVTVRVANASCGTGALATIYSSDDSTNPIAGSVVSGDSFGRYNFYAPDGRYDLTYTTPGAAAYNSCNIEIADVTQGTAGSFPGSSDAPWVSARINNIRFADQFAGADMGAKVNAAAADAASAGGGIVYIPTGIWPMSTSIVGQNNVQFLGYAEDATILTSVGGSLGANPVFNFVGSSGTHFSNIRVSGMTIRNGTADNTNYTVGQNGIFAVFVDGLEIDHVKLTEIQGPYAIYAKQCTRINVHDNQILRWTYAGIGLQNDNQYVWIDGNYLDTCTCNPANGGNCPNTYAIASGADNALGTNYTRDLWVTKNTVLNNPYWEGLDAHGGENIHFLNNHVENVRSCVNAPLSSGFVSNTVLKNIHIVGNTCIQGTGNLDGAGINVQGLSGFGLATGIEIRENKITGFGAVDASGADTVGVIGSTGGQTLDGVIENNKIYSYGQSAILFGTWNQDWLITGNHATDLAGAKSTAVSAFYTDRATGNYGITIRDNTLDATTAAGIPATFARFGDGTLARGGYIFQNNNLKVQPTVAIYSNGAFLPVNRSTIPTTMVPMRFGDPVLTTQGQVGWVVNSPTSGYGSLDTTDVVVNGNATSGSAVFVITSNGSVNGNSSDYRYIPLGMNVAIAGAGVAAATLNAKVIANDGTNLTLDTAASTTPANPTTLKYQALTFAAFQVNGSGNVVNGGSTTFAEIAAPGGVASSDVLYADSTAHRLKMNNNNGGALTVAATSGDTFTTTTLTSPIINGSPTGTGIPTLTLKKGSGGGNYTTASTTYAVVDSTNLCNTVTIPTGWKLHITASGDLGTSTAIVAASYAITDNAACSTVNAGILVEGQTFGNAAGNTEAFSKSWVITGDGAAHNIALQFKTANGADSALLLNSSATLLPTMTFILSPSN